MTKSYLRVASTWTKLYEPGNSVFLLNTSGTAIKILASTSKRRSFEDDADDEAITIGGCTTQVHFDNTKYIYAKAMLTGSEIDQTAIMLGDTKRINTADMTATQETIDDLTAEVMRLSTRVFNVEKNTNHHLIDYTLLTRAMINHILTIHNTESVLAKSIMKHNSRLLKLEQSLLDHFDEYHMLERYVNTLKNNNISADSFNSMTATVANMSNSLNMVISALDELTPKVAATYGDFESAITKQLNPVKAQVDELDADFTTLNNSVVRLVASRGNEDIENTFASIMETAPADLRDVITAIKNLILELMTATNVNDSQEEAIVTKVDYSDNVAASMSVDDLVTALDNDDDPTTGTVEN